jgi:tetratricopeptide (TPR) repeat protein
VLAIVLLRRAHRGGDASLRIISFGIVWFFVTLSVESSIIPIVDVIFEHRLYLPSVGFFMVLVPVVFLLMRKKTIKAMPAAAALFTVVIMTLAGATYARNMVWQSGISIWEDVVAKSPMNARGYNSLGTEFAKLKLYDKAMEEIQIAVRLQPDYIEAHNNLGVVYQALNMLDKAMGESEFAISRDPYFAKAYFNLAVIYYRMGRLDLAQKELMAGLSIKPDEEKARQLLEIISHH